jgi:hypothetical protein
MRSEGREDLNCAAAIGQILRNGGVILVIYTAGDK